MFPESECAQIKGATDQGIISDAEGPLPRAAPASGGGK